MPCYNDKEIKTFLQPDDPGMDDTQVVGNHVQETRKVGNIFDFSQSSAIFSSEKQSKLKHAST